VKSKINTIQILRGLSIIVVLISHAIARVEDTVILKNIWQIITCFHMPAFFIISGYLFENKLEKYTANGKKVRFIALKAKHLLLPYAFWTILLWIGVQVAYLSNGIGGLLTKAEFEQMSLWDLVKGLLTYNKFYTEHLWFLYVLFLFFVVNIIINKYGSNVMMLPIALFLGFLTRYIEFPHIIGRFFVWCVFFFFGRFICNNNSVSSLIRKIKKPIAFSIVTIAFIMFSVLRIVMINIDFNESIQLLVKYIIGFLGVWLLYGLAVYIENTRILKASGSIINKIGDYSYDIYLMHNPYCVAMGAIALNDIIGINSYITVVIATALGVIIPMIISRTIIRKSKLLSLIMLGK